jgi:hypothetical protein
MPPRRPAETVTGVPDDRTPAAVALSPGRTGRHRPTAATGSRELAGFRLAAAAIGSFVLDDAFVHRERARSARPPRA